MTPRVLTVLTAPTREGISPALYDAMCRAIDAAYEVDEVKDIRDRALAFEVYARQAQNVEAEHRACSIRLRSERKAGDLLRTMERAQGSRTDLSTSLDAPTKSLAEQLKRHGLSKDQAYQWQRLADVPEDQFEAALADPEKKPSTAGIIAAATPPKPAVVPVSAEALWLWGRLRDFERDGLLGRTVTDVMLTMTPEMADDVHRLAPRVATWLFQIGRAS